jgi:hypothetical protein
MLKTDIVRRKLKVYLAMTLMVAGFHVLSWNSGKSAPHIIKLAGANDHYKKMELKLIAESGSYKPAKVLDLTIGE